MFIKTADAATALFNPRRIDYSSSVGNARRCGAAAESKRCPMALGAGPEPSPAPWSSAAGPEQPPDFRRHQGPRG